MYIPRRVIIQDAAAVPNRNDVKKLVTPNGDTEQASSMNVLSNPLDPSQVDAGKVRQSVIEHLNTLPNTPGTVVAKQEILDKLSHRE